MKEASLIVAAIIALSSQTRARLGDTEEQVITVLGQSTDEQA